MKAKKLLVVGIVTLSLFQWGCATKKYTRSQVSDAEMRVTERVDGQVNDLQTQIEENQSGIGRNGQLIKRNEEAVAVASKTAQDALDRALAAGKLAEGKLLYETVFSSDDVRFGFENASLSEDAKATLDSFASTLKQENNNVYVEIQGHTDAAGPEDYNERLAEERATAVRRHLSKAGIPLHRMSVISYGETEPVTDNNSKEGRAQNRRVVLVVLQ